MDVSMHCAVCGTDLTVEDIEPAVNLGLVQQFRDVHTHSVGELKMYHDADVTVREYQHTHKYGELEDDDEP